MLDVQDVLTRVELALSQAKRNRREAQIAVIELARLRDILQPEVPAQGDPDEYSIDSRT